MKIYIRVSTYIKNIKVFSNGNISEIGEITFLYKI